MTIQTKRGTAFSLTEDQRQEAIKACHDGIANAKNIVDAAEGKKDASLGYALSAAFRALLCILTSQEVVTAWNRRPDDGSKKDPD